jgi:VIT1/CCC1 family predicted Fe2+/Mn2+ transporter
MYSLLKNIHSYWAYLVLLILILGIFNAIAGKIKGKDFESKDLRLSLFGLIFSHIQLLIGLILCFPLVWPVV